MSDEVTDLIDEVAAIIQMRAGDASHVPVLKEIGETIGFPKGREYISMHEIIFQRIHKPGAKYILPLSRWVTAEKAKMKPTQRKAFGVALATVKELREAKAAEA